jgi:uncharacterized protein
MPKVIFDIVHPAHVNLFKNAIKILSLNADVYISILDRGIVRPILENELAGFNFYTVTKRAKTKLGLIFKNNIVRAIKMFILIKMIKPDVGISCGQVSFSMPLTLLGIPNFQFSDDAERKMVVISESLFATQKFFPPIGENELKYLVRTHCYNAMKQWAYLHPNYFLPDKKALDPLGLKEREYVFIREVSTDSFNYLNQKEASLSQLTIPANYKILLSLENKEASKLYPRHWVILQEPVEGFHSLIYYSAGVISSGDSLAREAALLGVPSIYTGIRDMAANRVLIDRGILYAMGVTEANAFINSILDKSVTIKDQEAIRMELAESMEDITQLIVNCASGKMKL